MATFDRPITKYADLKVGHVFPDEPVTFEVTAEVVDGYCESTRESSDFYKPGSTAGPGGKRPAPPTIAGIYMVDAVLTLPAAPGGVHAKQKFTFHRPPCVGETLYTSVEIVEKYEKKGRNYVVMATTTKNQDGDLVTEGLMTRIWGKED